MTYTWSDEAQDQRENAAFKHGLRSERKIRPLARNKKRAFLRRNRLLASALDGPTLAHLNRWARLEAMADLASRFLDERGLMREDGEVEPLVRFVISVENSGRLAMRELQASLRAHGQGDETSLEDYLRERYGGDGGEERPSD